MTPLTLALLSLTCGEAWWSLQPLARPPVPAVKGRHWPRTAADAFVLATLEAKGLSPSPEADRLTLLRRVTFDLTGLPPTPDEQDAFLSDRRPDAYERVAERLLASPGYGERWGRHWLDVARYADTHGYDKDKRRDHAWRYRDWVIAALNAGKPYRDFVREQLAGDVLSPGSADGLIATGFIAAGPWDFVGHVELREGTVDKLKTRVLDRDDMVSSTLGAFASLTVGCARCHDHKFDPIPQKDYYALQAVFAGVERGNRRLSAAGGGTTNGYHSRIEAKPDATKWVQIDLGATRPVEAVHLFPARPVDFRDTPGFGFPVRYKVELSDDAAFATAAVLLDRTSADVPNPGDVPQRIDAGGRKGRYVRVTATKLWKRLDDYAFALAEAQVVSGGEVVSGGKPVTARDTIDAGLWARRHLVDGVIGRTPRGGAEVYTVVPIAPRPIHLLRRGDVELPKAETPPRGLSCVDLPAAFAAKTEGERRLALADWLTHPKHPLTWRSAVNRVWHHHFGRGLVDTPNDFGRMGSLPTHPALLDWLAAEFRDGGGSLKALHRLLVTAAAYRQAGRHDGAAVKVDGDNRLLWRMSRRRLDAEALRDATLCVSGAMDRRAGGPGYDLFRFKDDHSPTYDHTAVERLHDPATYRRTVYRFTVRSVPNPFLDCLDCADPNQPVPARNTTLTALQALALLNNPFMVRQSALFADRLRAATPDAAGQVGLAHRLAFGRPADAPTRAALAEHARGHGLAATCRVLLNANEFVFVD